MKWKELEKLVKELKEKVEELEARPYPFVPNPIPSQPYPTPPLMPWYPYNPFWYGPTCDLRGQ